MVLRTQPADDTEGLPVSYFDTVIVNSVIQYFPSAEYLMEVLGALSSLLAPGGTLFVGDVRNLRLQDAFAAAVARHRAGPATDAPAIRRAVERTIAAETELLIDPELFCILA